MKLERKSQSRVGIFWLLGDKLLIESTPLSKAEPYGDKLTFAAGHIDCWAELKRKGVIPRELEYDEPPRGRVTYDQKVRQFTLYADRCILGNREITKKIVRRLISAKRYEV